MRAQGNDGTVGDMLRTRQTKNELRESIAEVRERVVFWQGVAMLISIVNVILLGMILL